MNTITEPDRKLAEALKSLSLAPATETTSSGSPRKIARRCALASIILASIAAPIACIFMWPNVASSVVALLPEQQGAEAAVSEKVATSTIAVKVNKPEAFSGRESTSASTREITGSGYVVAPRSTAVFSRYEGRITGIAVEAGDRVEAGQVLITLDDASARFALEQAEAARVSADLVLSARTIELTQANASLRRIEVLATRAAMPQKDLEAALTASQSASNAVAQARQDIDRAEIAVRIAGEQLNELTVRAPFAGTVAKVGAHIGDTVLARVDSIRENQSLLTLIDMGNMVIDADVAETNIAMIYPGMRGEAVLDGFPDRPFTIDLAKIAPIASVEKGTIALRFSLIDPPIGIRPNMAARIRIAAPNFQELSGEINR